MLVAPRQPSTTGSPGRDFSGAEAREIACVAEAQGWQVAAHDYMRSLNQEAYRLATDEYSAQLRFLLPLTANSSVLQLRCGWGPVAFNLATFTGSVVAMDERRAMLRFVNTRREQMSADRLHPVCADLSTNLPFADEAFDAVILLDALEWIGAATDANWETTQYTSLKGVRRVLRPGGWLLLGIANRLSFKPLAAASPQRLHAYWGYRRALQRAGFNNIRFHAALPSHREPFFMVPLDRPRSLQHFINWMLDAQDYRSKLEERGLRSGFRIARMMWQVSQLLRLGGLVRYFVPAYLILAQR